MVSDVVGQLIYDGSANSCYHQLRDSTHETREGISSQAVVAKKAPPALPPHLRIPSEFLIRPKIPTTSLVSCSPPPSAAQVMPEVTSEKVDGNLAVVDSRKLCRAKDMRSNEESNVRTQSESEIAQQQTRWFEALADNRNLRRPHGKSMLCNESYEERSPKELPSASCLVASETCSQGTTQSLASTSMPSHEGATPEKSSLSSEAECATQQKASWLEVLADNRNLRRPHGRNVLCNESYEERIPEKLSSVSSLPASETYSQTAAQSLASKAVQPYEDATPEKSFRSSGAECATQQQVSWFEALADNRNLRRPHSRNLLCNEERSPQKLPWVSSPPTSETCSQSAAQSIASRAVQRHEDATPEKSFRSSGAECATQQNASWFEALADNRNLRRPHSRPNISKQKLSPEKLPLVSSLSARGTRPQTTAQQFVAKSEQSHVHSSPEKSSLSSEAWAWEESCHSQALSAKSSDWASILADDRNMRRAGREGAIQKPSQQEMSTENPQVIDVSPQANIVTSTSSTDRDWWSTLADDRALRRRHKDHDGAADSSTQYQQNTESIIETSSVQHRSFSLAEAAPIPHDWMSTLRDNRCLRVRNQKRIDNESRSSETVDGEVDAKTPSSIQLLELAQKFSSSTSLMHRIGDSSTEVDKQKDVPSPIERYLNSGHSESQASVLPPAVSKDNWLSKLSDNRRLRSRANDLQPSVETHGAEPKLDEAESAGVQNIVFADHEALFSVVGQHGKESAILCTSLSSTQDSLGDGYEPYEPACVAETATVTFQLGPVGITCFESDHHVVGGVLAGSQAEQEGVQAGWRIIAVGNQSCGSFQDPSFLNARNGSETYQLTFKKEEVHGVTEKAEEFFPRGEFLECFECPETHRRWFWDGASGRHLFDDGHWSKLQLLTSERSEQKGREYWRNEVTGAYFYERRVPPIEIEKCS